ncbi:MULTISPECIES: nicotinate-nucleotide adenylyltransferase [Pseudovibrio]|uniref:nicotinate-nucleotide adenylyltransferase n=1 Tax=Stappiaceae TaxID=2821832 RepID=UPI00236683A8|nr:MULTISPECIES: nicotinate-nucleotide adenylyltransferase [Pseudovibrio]MDD7909824.1 nicotinate-nucleotide adenylyltransferase [Pseudovibrio exalbescens]MDX5592164.1 nicotinate-nucleotide adenylyltransferase [Pseudovibrio sp. SPO723]
MNTNPETSFITREETSFADWLRLPYAAPGNKIGLFGGSFNPPHSGHLLVAETALKRLGLDQIWWLVTPGNPLKQHNELAPLEARVEAVKDLAQHPKMRVTAHEVMLGTPYTAKTLAALQAKQPLVKFVWVMGADNLAGFHRWQDWRGIVNRVPIAIVNRPGATLSPLSAPMSVTYAQARLPEHKAPLLSDIKAPAWTFLTGPLDASSSTNIRAGRNNK